MLPKSFVRYYKYGVYGCMGVYVCVRAGTVFVAWLKAAAKSRFKRRVASRRVAAAADGAVNVGATG